MPLFTGFCTPQVVQDFFHQQLDLPFVSMIFHAFGKVCGEQASPSFSRACKKVFGRVVGHLRGPSRCPPGTYSSKMKNAY